MKKQTSFSTKGQRADIGDLTIHRLLANRYPEAEDPFVMDSLTEIGDACSDFYLGKYGQIIQKR
ncbi:hypothetical protein [Algoriphagus sp. Y33]|uniref:hypothetical protein n=1 Tax=Algoriphagus sp. Y33 TaxID=2772483 RepID=UPI00177E8A58|nr:hypothetical protein [Algoriphagus sp. Y33]